MDRTTSVLIVLIVVLVGILVAVVGLNFQGNPLNSTNNSSVNQSNLSPNNRALNNTFNDINGNNDTNASSDAQNDTYDHANNGVAYRISSNTPDCPNCGSNNIVQIGETLIDPNTDEWVAFSRCLYCGYEWEYRVSRGFYT